MSETMSWTADVATAVKHAAADLMMKLANVHRGWTTLLHDEPFLQQAVALAVTEAKARGVPIDAIVVGATAVIQAVEGIAASGHLPSVVAEQTKAPDGPVDSPAPIPVAAIGDTPSNPYSKPEPKVTNPEPEATGYAAVAPPLPYRSDQ